MLIYEDGKIGVKGHRIKSIQEVAGAAAYVTVFPKMKSQVLDETSYFDPANFVWPFGTHICVVEVEKETGSVKIVNYIAVDDVGNVVNPMIVDGQIHGGIAQGIAQALWESGEYNDDPVSWLKVLLLDYAFPRTDCLPNFELRSHCHSLSYESR